MLRNIILIVFLVIATAQVVWAGGWPQPKGHGYFKLAQWWLISDRHYTDAGLIDPNVTTGVFNTSLYAEYGFTNRLTGVLYFPFYSRSYFNNTVSGTTGEVLIPGESINSIGDTELGLKYGLIVNKPVVLSATLMLGLPLGNDSGGSLGNLQTGDGEFNQMLQIDAGASFKIGQQNAYANMYTAYNNRTNNFSDEIRFGVEGGVTFFKDKITTILRLYGIRSLKNGDLAAGINSTSIFANNSEHLTIAPEIAYNINEKWGVSAGFGTALSGKIIFADPAYSVGIFFKL